MELSYSNFEHQSSTNLENCKLGIWSFGNLISKCNRLSEHIKHIIAIDVLYKLRNKQKDYVISRETPCIRHSNHGNLAVKVKPFHS